MLSLANQHYPDDRLESSAPLSYPPDSDNRPVYLLSVWLCLHTSRPTTLMRNINIVYFLLQANMPYITVQWAIETLKYIYQTY